MRDFLEKELDKLKISKGEREILIETYEEQREWFEEDFISEHSRKPNEKEEKKFIKDFLEKNAEYRKPPLRQAEKEKAIRQCLLEAI